MVEITLSTGEPVVFQPGPARQFKGTRLPGGTMSVASNPSFGVTIHEYSDPQFSISLRQFTFTREQKIVIRELSKGLRLEMMLHGQLHINNMKGQEFIMYAGEYRMTEGQAFLSHNTPGSTLSYVSIRYSDELLQGMRMGHVMATDARPVPEAVRGRVLEILANVYSEAEREFYYANSVRDLLFHHLVVPPVILPGEMTKAEVAACYLADKIISENLSKHHTIQELARLCNTNVYVLKTGFQKLFSTGVFERLQTKKMERATLLLKTTNLQIQMVAEESGYETLVGFANSFRKWYNMTPKQYRKRSRGL